MNRMNRYLTKFGGLLLIIALLQGPVSAQEDFTLNFQDADIGTLIATISELTGKNFVIDPRVKGNVTVLSSEPMDADGVYATFLSILQVHGFAAVPAGDVIKIVPEVVAKQAGGPSVGTTRIRGIGEEVVTQVVEVQNVPAAQLVAILRPLVPQYGHLAAYTPSNMLILSDRADNVARLMQIIARIDQTGDSEIEVVRLEHATATEVARLVNSLNLSQEAKKADPTSAGVTIVPDERTNSILISGDKSERLRIKAIVTNLDTPVDSGGDTQVVYLRYAKAETLAPILEGYAEEAQAQAGEKGAESSSASNRPGVRILPEPDINALVITAPPKTMRAIRNVITQLDIRRAQVLVEAIIAEVSLNKTRELGVDWALLDDDEVAAAGLLSLDPADLASAVAQGNAVGLLRSGLNIGGGTSDDGRDFAILIRALRGDGNTNILSTPNLVTLDNEEAEITVGQEVPFLTGSFSNTGATNGSVNPFQTVERRDVGLTLKITPQINEGKSVQLKIEQETSGISAGSDSAVDLITNKRTLTTSVLVDSGDILVLGGLIDDQLIETETAVPLLSRIPLLGELFRSRSVTKDKRNLMIFIRPVILRDGGQANYYTRQKYDFMRQRFAEEYKAGSYLIDRDSRPVMPEISIYDTPPLTGNGAAQTTTTNQTSTDTP